MSIERSLWIKTEWSLSLILSKVFKLYPYESICEQLQRIKFVQASNDSCMITNTIYQQLEFAVAQLSSSCWSNLYGRLSPSLYSSAGHPERTPLRVSAGFCGCFLLGTVSPAFVPNSPSSLKLFTAYRSIALGCPCLYSTHGLNSSSDMQFSWTNHHWSWLSHVSTRHL
jgi:hypothetical protein